MNPMLPNLNQQLYLAFLNRPRWEQLQEMTEQPLNNLNCGLSTKGIFASINHLLRFMSKTVSGLK